MPTPQTAFARVYFNGKLWGVYVIVEQINGDFLKRYYDDTSGVRVKGDNPTRVALGSSTLEYKAGGYQSSYELKTSQPTAWAQIGNMIAKLDNGPTGTLEKDISSVINVDRALWYLATNSVVHNCDSYDTGGHNYYMYIDPLTGLMNMCPWDCNYSFGVFKFFLTTSAYERHDPITLSSQVRTRRPLKERLLMVPKCAGALSRAHSHDFGRELQMGLGHEGEARCLPKGRRRCRQGLPEPLVQPRLVYRQRHHAIPQWYIHDPRPQNDRRRAPEIPARARGDQQADPDDFKCQLRAAIGPAPWADGVGASKESRLPVGWAQLSFALRTWLTPNSR